MDRRNPDQGEEVTTALLQQSAARLKAILDTTVDGIITINNQAIVQDFNRAAERIFGYSAEEVIGRNVNMLMPEPYHSQHDTYLANYLETGVKKVIGIGREVLGRRKDSTVFPIDLAVSETRVNGRPVFTGLIRDITERKEAERERERMIAELEAKNAEMERFTYTVSHDLKSPLITIRGFLGMLEKDALQGDMERLRGDIRRISTATEKMQRLLDELLELSRVGRLINEPEAVPVGELAREAVALVAGRIAAGQVRVRIAPDLPVARVDRPRLVEVFQNLLDNAVKFMADQPEPSVEIGAEDRDGETVFYVRDNGVGIDPRYHDKVFRLFERLDQDTEGTGIGLALVKRIVEVHGGRIWVESEGPGRGTAFFFTLPAKG